MTPAALIAAQHVTCEGTSNPAALLSTTRAGDVPELDVVCGGAFAAGW